MCGCVPIVYKVRRDFFEKVAEQFVGRYDVQRVEKIDRFIHQSLR